MSTLNKFKWMAALLALATVGGCGGGGSGPKTSAAPSGTIVFASDRDDSGNSDPALGDIAYGSLDIYRMNADGSNVTRLTDNAPVNDLAPALSPDGQTILFVSQGRTGDSTAQIYAINADGSNLRRLTNTPIVKSNPSWSFDGSRIVFDAARAEGGRAIFTMNADGSGQTQLTDNTYDGGNPVFNRDGSKILFLSARFVNAPPDVVSYASPQIYQMNADGSDVSQFSRNDDFPAPTSFAFSPDGTRLLISSDRGYMGYGEAGVFVLRADGSGARQINSSGSDAVWSPDGQRIAYAAPRGDGTRDAESGEIYTAKTDGTDVQRLTDNGASDGAPSWR